MRRWIRGSLAALLLLAPTVCIAQTVRLSAHVVPCASPAQAFVDDWNLVGGKEGPLGCAWRDATSESNWNLQEFHRGVIAHHADLPEAKLFVWSMRSALWMRLVLPTEFNGEPVAGFDVAVLNSGGGSSSFDAAFPFAVIGPGVPSVFANPAEGWPTTLQLWFRVRRIAPASVDADGNWRAEEPVEARVDAGQVTVAYTPHQIDFSFAADASLLPDWPTLARQSILRFNACWDRETGFSLKERGAEDFVIIALAKLGAAREGMTHCPLDKLMGTTDDLKRQTQNAILASTPVGYPGTSIDGIVKDVCKREGEYDTAMWGLVRLLYTFENELRERVDPMRLSPYDHILEAMLRPHAGRYRMPASYTTGGFCGMEVPETENHILLLESSRYLINQLLKKKYGSAPSWDNGANGQSQWILRQLQRFFEQDFYEYNSRPYQRYSWYALANLADYADDENVATAARLVITYLDAKFAVSAQELRRYPPMRRKPEAPYSTTVAFFEEVPDAHTARSVFFTGLTSRLDNRSEPRLQVKPTDRMNRSFRVAHHSLSHHLLIAATTKQAPHPEVLGLMRAAQPSSSFHRFLHRGDAEANHFTASNEGFEIYAAGPGYVLSAGGGFHDHGYDYDKYPAENLVLGASNLAAEAPAELLGDLLGGPLWLPGKIVGAALGAVLYPVVRKIAKDRGNDAASKNRAVVRPTTLITGVGTRTASETLQFLGSRVPGLQFNSCVAPNFLCGMRPRLPAFKVAGLDLCSRYRLFDADIMAFWSIPSNRDQLGCPRIGGERKTPDGTVVEFDNGIVFKSIKEGGKIQSIVVDSAAMPAKITYRWETAAPGHDYYLPFLMYPAQWNGVWGAWGGHDAFDFQLSTTGQWTFEAPVPGRQTLSLRGCGDGPGPEVEVTSLYCRELFEFMFDVADPARSAPPPLPVCAAQMPEHAMPGARNMIALSLGLPDDVSGECEPLINIGLITAVCDEKYDQPQCEEHGGSFGLAEVVPARGSFDEFAAEFAKRNRTRLFRFNVNAPNQFVSTTNQTIAFDFQPSGIYQWAIKSHSDLPAVASDMTAWPLVAGDLVNGKDRLVTIRNPSTSKTLALDFADEQSPKLVD